MLGFTPAAKQSPASGLLWWNTSGVYELCLSQRNNDTLMLPVQTNYCSLDEVNNDQGTLSPLTHTHTHPYTHTNRMTKLLCWKCDAMVQVMQQQSLSMSVCRWISIIIIALLSTVPTWTLMKELFSLFYFLSQSLNIRQLSPLRVSLNTGHQLLDDLLNLDET